jgi:hypothetical protein
MAELPLTPPQPKSGFAGPGNGSALYFLIAISLASCCGASEPVEKNKRKEGRSEGKEFGVRGEPWH